MYMYMYNEAASAYILHIGTHVIASQVRSRVRDNQVTALR